MFYLHKQMQDGHLNKCKECTKSDVSKNRLIRSDYYRAFDKKRKAKGYIKPVKNTKIRTFTMDWYTTFKGTSAEYRNLHRWVEKMLGRPSKCEHCKKDDLRGRSIHWANKSGAYIKDTSDWLRLCARCHIIHDSKTMA